MKVNRSLRSVAAPACALLAVAVLAACQDAPTLPSMDLDPQFAAEASSAGPVRWDFEARIVGSKGKFSQADGTVTGWIAFDPELLFVAPGGEYGTRYSGPGMSWEARLVGTTREGDPFDFTFDGSSEPQDPRGEWPGYVRVVDDAIPGGGQHSWDELHFSVGGWPGGFDMILKAYGRPELIQGSQVPLTPPSLDVISSAGGQKEVVFASRPMPDGWGFDDLSADLTSLTSGPQSKDDCMNGGWERYGFKNQGQCVRFVETGKDSR